ncbi:MAG TPA: hypothetical protein VF601_05525 [Beijerinckiaceae bacterium]|jgi:hypothetical protein
MKAFLAPFALTAALALAEGAAAQGPAVALAVSGWESHERDGITYYRCASSICAAGSVVSYKKQPHRPTLTLADFEGHHRGLVEQNKGRGRIRDVRLADVRERTIEGVRVMQARREVDWADGTATYTIEARLIGPKSSYSLVSDSPGRDWTSNNFEGFLPRLVDFALLRTP